MSTKGLFPLSSSFLAPPTNLKVPYEDKELLEAVFKEARRRVAIVISLDAVKNNIRVLKSLTGPSTQIMAVVKGGAYGSGVEEVVKAVLEEGAKELAVATVSEGVYLRKSGITVPIAILGNLNIEEVPDVLEHKLYPTISWDRCINTIPSTSLKYPDSSPLEVHIEIDTGMSRYGVQPEGLAALVEAVEKRSIKIRSLYTHLQSAITKPDLNGEQVEKFTKAIQAHPGIPLHLAATTGCVQGLGVDLEFIRPGGSVTGLSSGSDEDDVAQFAKCGFQPAFSLVMKPSYYKLLAPGRAVGYDGTYVSQQDEWIANFSTGWSDGLARKLTNQGFVKRLKTDQLCPIVGRVSMDSITVRLPEEPSPDEVFVLITADFHPLTSAVGIARNLGAAVYEVPGNWSARLPRVSVLQGKVKRVQDSLTYSN